MRLPLTWCCILYRPVLLLLPVLQCQPGLMLHEAAASKLLVRAAAEVVQQHYTTSTSQQLYLRWEDTPELIDELVKRTATHLTVLLESNPPQPADEPAQLGPHQQLRVLNLLVVADYHGFERAVNELRDELYDFSGLYTVVVVAANHHAQCLEIAGAMLRTLWARHIVNAVVLIEPTDRSAMGGVRIYTYFPYGEGYCERALPVVWNVYEPGGGGFKHRERDLFPRKLRNFYSCPLVVATFPVFPFIITANGDGVEAASNELAGIEGLLLRTLMQRLNFRLQLSIVDPPDWGTAGPREQSTGASAYIRHLRANLTIGYWATTLHRNRYMASSFSYYTSQLVLAIAPGEPYSSLELLLCPFASPIWMLLLAALTTGLAVIALLRRAGCSPALQRLVLGHAPDSAWPGMVNVLLGGGIPQPPARNFARTLLLCWLGGTLVLRSAYTGAMFRYLQVGRNHTVPDDIPALLAGGYKLYMYRNYSFVYDAYPSIRERLRLVTAQQFRGSIVQQLQLSGAPLCVLLPVETVTFLNRNITRNGQLLRIGRQRAYVAKLAIYTQRTSPLLGPLNKLLEMFVSSGLLNRWAGEYHQAQFLADPYRRYRGHQQLRLVDILGPCIILLAGIGLSAVAFVAELLIHTTNTTRTRYKIPVGNGRPSATDYAPSLRDKS